MTFIIIVPKCQQQKVLLLKIRSYFTIPMRYHAFKKRPCASGLSVDAALYIHHTILKHFYKFIFLNISKYKYDTEVSLVLPNSIYPHLGSYPTINMLPFVLIEFFLHFLNHSLLIVIKKNTDEMLFSIKFITNV